jgi:hypothetical protein
MLRFRHLLGLAGGGVVLFLVAPATSALAIGTTPPPTTTGGNTITVTVVGTGVKGGSAGHAGSRSVSVPAPCAMLPGFTGKEYYEWVHSGQGLVPHRRRHGRTL